MWAGETAIGWFLSRTIHHALWHAWWRPPAASVWTPLVAAWGRCSVMGAPCAWLHVLCLGVAIATRGSQEKGIQEAEGVAMWIDEEQVRKLNGIPMDIYAILDGHVLPYILEPSFEKYLPTIPPEVEHVNFTWKAGKHRIHYNFEKLHSFNQTILDHPSVSIATRGRVPRRPTDFTVFLSCSGEIQGLAMFGLHLLLHNRHGRALPGMPLRLRINKRCVLTGACLEGCLNGGTCLNSVCACAHGYYGPRCQFDLCHKRHCRHCKSAKMCRHKNR